MEYKVKYETYNNRDFKQTVFCETQQDAEEMMFRLKKIKHITAITIVPPEIHPTTSGVV